MNTHTQQRENLLRLAREAGEGLVATLTRRRSTSPGPSATEQHILVVGDEDVKCGKLLETLELVFVHGLKQPFFGSAYAWSSVIEHLDYCLSLSLDKKARVAREFFRNGDTNVQCPFVTCPEAFAELTPLLGHLESHIDAAAAALAWVRKIAPPKSNHGQHETGCLRVFLRHSLNDSMLHEYLDAFASTPSLLNKAYHDWAFLRSSNDMDMLLLILESLRSVSFSTCESPEGIESLTFWEEYEKLYSSTRRRPSYHGASSIHGIDKSLVYGDSENRDEESAYRSAYGSGNQNFLAESSQSNVIDLEDDYPYSATSLTSPAKEIRKDSSAASIPSAQPSPFLASSLEEQVRKSSTASNYSDGTLKRKTRKKGRKAREVVLSEAQNDIHKEELDADNGANVQQEQESDTNAERTPHDEEAGENGQINTELRKDVVDSHVHATERYKDTRPANTKADDEKHDIAKVAARNDVVASAVREENRGTQILNRLNGSSGGNDDDFMHNSEDRRVVSLHSSNGVQDHEESSNAVASVNIHTLAKEEATSNPVFEESAPSSLDALVLADELGAPKPFSEESAPSHVVAALKDADVIVGEDPPAPQSLNPFHVDADAEAAQPASDGHNIVLQLNEDDERRDSSDAAVQDEGDVDPTIRARSLTEPSNRDAELPGFSGVLAQSVPTHNSIAMGSRKPRKHSKSYAYVSSKLIGLSPVLRQHSLDSAKRRTSPIASISTENEAKRALSPAEQRELDLSIMSVSLPDWRRMRHASVSEEGGRVSLTGGPGSFTDNLIIDDYEGVPQDGRKEPRTSSRSSTFGSAKIGLQLPSQHLIIERIHHPKGAEREAALQNCRSCGRALDSSFNPILRNSRYCFYTGAYYCKSCHHNEMSIIPARVLHHWEFKSHPVCHEGAAHIDALRNAPVMDLGPFPHLYEDVSKLAKLRDIRIRLRAAGQLLSCPMLPKAVPPHFTTSLHLYTLDELHLLCKGSLLPIVELYLKEYEGHVLHCSNCRTKGSHCARGSQCTKPHDLLFPFMDVAQCFECHKLYHTQCLPDRGCACMLEGHEQQEEHDSVN